MPRHDTEDPRATAEAAAGPDASLADDPGVVPRAYVGLWVAWSADGRRILGATETLEEAERLAARHDETEAIFERPAAPHRP